MPPRLSPNAAITHGRRRSAFLALTLAGLVASLFAIGVPQAVAGDDSGPPSTPKNLKVLSATQTSVTIVWDASTDDIGVEGYKVWYGVRPTPRTIEPKYTIAGLKCGQSTRVEVRAYDHAGYVSGAARAIVSSAPCFDSQAPSAPSSLRQTSNSSTTATLAWNPASDNVAVAGYSLSRGGVEVGTTNQTAYTFAGLACGKSHAVAVRAYDTAQNYSSWASFYVATAACGDVSAPSAPQNLVQTNKTTTGMTVAWSASTDNVGVARYDVFRNGSLVGPATSLSYTLSGLTCGTSHTVGVEAVDGAGNQSSRTQATMSTATCSTPPPPTNDTQAPSKPTGLSLPSASANSLTLAWLPSTDNVGVTGYDVYRNGSQLQIVTGTQYVFQGLPCGIHQELGVQAHDAAGNRSSLATVIEATASCSSGGSGGSSSAPTVPQNLILLDRTSTSVTVSWAASSGAGGVAGYGAYVDGQLAGSTPATNFTFTNLPCNTTKVFSVDAYDAQGSRSAKANIALATTDCDDTQPPTAPQALVVSGETQSSMTLSWPASTDNTAVAGYDVYVNGTKTATVTGTSYALNGLNCGTTYTLGVEAFDTSGLRSSRTTASDSTAQCSQPPSSGSVFVSPSGSDSNVCSAAFPCKSLNRAYVVAAPGATVNVAGGSYPSQTIDWISGRDTAAQVRFVPQGTVSVNGNLEVKGSGVWLDGTATGSITSWRSRSFNIVVSGYTSVEGRSSTQFPRNVTLEGIDTANLGTYSADNVRVSDVDVGPSMLDWNGGCSAPENKIAANGVAYPKEPNGVVWERVAIHDQNRTLTAANNDCHYGGLFIVNGQGITLRDSVFEQNVVYNIQIQNFAGGVPRNVTIENSWFGCPVDNSWVSGGVNRCNNQPSIQFNAASQFSDFLIRYNSFVSSIGQYVPGASYSNVRIVGNVGDQPSAVCGKSGITFTKNVWTGGSCGSSDKLVSSLGFVSTTVGAEDLHLASGSAAIDAGDPSNKPAADIDGQSRPLGGAPDAGADERS